MLSSLRATQHSFSFQLSIFFLSTWYVSKYFFTFCTTDMCLIARGGCSHQCTVAPGKGVVCSCPPGLHLDWSNKTCEVVDYCSRHLKCSQVCEQYKTTVKCSCYPGWILDSDGDSCHSAGSRRWHFIVSFMTPLAVLVLRIFSRTEYYVRASCVLFNL